MVNIPTGFVKKPKPRSVAEAVSQNSHDRLKTIAKSAIQGYISSYMDTTGVNRSLVTASSPAGLSFVTDLSLQDSNDSSYRPTQLARMYNEVRQKFPSILIIDKGFEWVPSGLNGGLESASNVNGKWQGYFRLFGRVPMTVAIVTQDQETTDMLMNILMLIFSPFRNMSGGSKMNSSNPADLWEVRLPLTFEIGANTGQEYEGDPTGRFWSSTIDMLVDVEDQIGIETDLLSADVQGGVVNSVNLVEQLAPRIMGPETVGVSSGPFQISISGYNPLSHRVVIDNPDIATIELGPQIYVTPHRTGTFNIKIMSNQLAQGSNPKAPMTYTELHKLGVTVIF